MIDGNEETRGGMTRGRLVTFCDPEGRVAELLAAIRMVDALGPRVRLDVYRDDAGEPMGLIVLADGALAASPRAESIGDEDEDGEDEGAVLYRHSRRERDAARFETGMTSSWPRPQSMVDAEIDRANAHGFAPLFGVRTA